MSFKNNKLKPVSKQIWDKLETDTFNTATTLSITELENIILQASKAYYTTQTPLISDEAFDIIVDIMRKKDPHNTVLNTVGSELPPNATNKVPLPYYLGSMDKIKPGSRALSIWLDKYRGPYTISEKLDGLSGLLIIKLDSNDELEMQLYTRGNGNIGQDISHLLAFLVPLSDSARSKIVKYLKKTNGVDHIAIRGEIILNKQTFSAKYAKEYPKARSFVAGLVNAKIKKYESQLYRNKAKDMDFVAYQIIKPNNMKSIEQFNMLSSNWGIKTAKYAALDALDDVAHLEELLLEFKDNSLYEIDGIIVADDSKVWPQPRNGNPKHSVAFKMALAGQTQTTTVVNVEYNVSKQGYLKPRVQFKPVVIGGDTITFATGFNAKFIKDNKLGPGAKIEVIKSGDVIPYIKHVITPAGKWQEPNIPYVWTDSHVDAIVEDPSKMPEYISSRLTYFFNVLDVDGLRQGTIERLISAGFDTIELILSLRPESLVDVDGFGVKAINNLLGSIKRNVLNKEHSLPLIMAASGCFPGFALKKIKLIVDGLLSSSILPEYVSRLENELTKTYDIGDKKNIINIKRLSMIDGVAATTAKLFINYLDCFHKWLTATPKIRIQSLSNYVKNKTAKPKTFKQLLGITGKAVLFTGFRDKDLENKLVNEYGVHMKSSMSSQVELLIVADMDKKNSKMVKADKMGIPIMSYDEIKNKINSK